MTEIDGSAPKRESDRLCPFTICCRASRTKDGFVSVGGDPHIPAEEGFYGSMPDFVGDDGVLNIEVTVPGTDKKVYVKDEPIGPDIYLAYCSESESDDVRFME